MVIFDLSGAAFNLAVAMVCGAAIGSERQMRQRMAGLRTNALVAMGAAGFVIFSQLFPNEASPTRVAAQVVSGIGFLGAGIIFRDGFNVHGLNTAATLWCSAAVGLMSGVGAWPFALLLTGMVMFINVGLRPVVRWLKRNTNAGLPLIRQYRVVVTCGLAHEPAARAMILRVLTTGGLQISEVAAQPVDDGTGIELAVTVSGLGMSDRMLEQAVLQMAGETGLARIGWEVIDEA